MRMLVIKQNTDLQGLSASLMKKDGGEAQPAVLARLAALNPHADLRRLVAGTVILVPDDPALDANNSLAVGGDIFGDLATELTAGLGLAAKRARAASDAASADRTAVTAVLRSAGVKRLVSGDEALKAQIEEAGTRAKLVQAQTDDAVKTIEAMQSLATKAFEQVRGLLR